MIATSPVFELLVDLYLYLFLFFFSTSFSNSNWSRFVTYEVLWAIWVFQPLGKVRWYVAFFLSLFFFLAKWRWSRWTLRWQIFFFSFSSSCCNYFFLLFLRDKGSLFLFFQRWVYWRIFSFLSSIPSSSNRRRFVRSSWGWRKGISLTCTWKSGLKINSFIVSTVRMPPFQVTKSLSWSSYKRTISSALRSP